MSADYIIQLSYRNRLKHMIDLQIDFSVVKKSKKQAMSALFAINFCCRQTSEKSGEFFCCFE